MINFIIWNIRGIFNVNASNRLKILMWRHQLGVFVLLEPMVESYNVGKIKHKFLKFQIVNNFSNNIWLFCRKEFQVNVIVDDIKFLHISVSNYNMEIFAIIIYSSCSVVLIRELWEK